MIRKTMFLVIALSFLTAGSAQASGGLKVFISVDMEGVTGVVHWEEVSRDGKDYDLFRRLMTEEANAAIEGALAAGADEIIVRDSHGSARNILPDLLHPEAKLLRAWSGGWMSMMEGFDDSFDAVVFIGYHAKAGTPDALLEHTSSGNVADVSINNVSLPEAGINGLIAGHFDVPVVFVAGDQAICDQSKMLFGDVETMAVKEGIGNSALNLHPGVAQDKIRAGVEKALRNIKKYKPYKLQAPYTLVVTLKKEELVRSKSFYPGTERTGDWELTFRTNEIMEAIKAYYYIH